MRLSVYVHSPFLSFPHSAFHVLPFLFPSLTLLFGHFSSCGSHSPCLPVFSPFFFFLSLSPSLCLLIPLLYSLAPLPCVLLICPLSTPPPSRSPPPFILGSPTVVMRCFIICISQLLIEREFRLSPGSSVRELPWET